MNAAQLKDVWKWRGLRLVLVEGKVRVFPRKLLTDDDRVQIKRLKYDLILFLSRRQAASDRDDLAQSGSPRPPGHSAWYAAEPPVTTPVITSTTLRTPATEAELASPAPAEGSFIPSAGASAGRKWRCGNFYCFHKERWWMSKYGVVQCTNCKPPGFPELVVADGDASNAPIVEPNSFRQAVEYPRSIHVTVLEPGSAGERAPCKLSAKVG